MDGDLWWVDMRLVAGGWEILSGSVVVEGALTLDDAVRRAVARALDGSTQAAGIRVLAGPGPQQAVLEIERCSRGVVLDEYAPCGALARQEMVGPDSARVQVTAALRRTVERAARWTGRGR